MSFPFPIFFLLVLLLSTMVCPQFWVFIFAAFRKAGLVKVLTITARIGVLLACLLICILRCYVPHVVPSLPGTYEALAHLFVGALIGAWLFCRDRVILFGFIAISLFEGAAFFLTR